MDDHGGRREGSGRLSLEDLTRGIPGWLPIEARRCRHCNVPLEPVVVEWEPVGPGEPGFFRRDIEGGRRRCRPVRVAAYGYGDEGLFCTLRCGYEHGVQHVRSLSTDD